MSFLKEFYKQSLFNYPCVSLSMFSSEFLHIQHEIRQYTVTMHFFLNKNERIVLRVYADDSLTYRGTIVIKLNNLTYCFEKNHDEYSTCLATYEELGWTTEAPTCEINLEFYFVYQFNTGVKLPLPPTVSMLNTNRNSIILSMFDGDCVTNVHLLRACSWKFHAIFEEGTVHMKNGFYRLAEFEAKTVRQCVRLCEGHRMETFTIRSFLKVMQFAAVFLFEPLLNYLCTWLHEHLHENDFINANYFASRGVPELYPLCHDILEKSKRNQNGIIPLCSTNITDVEDSYFMSTINTSCVVSLPCELITDSTFYTQNFIKYRDGIDNEYKTDAFPWYIVWHFHEGNAVKPDMAYFYIHIEKDCLVYFELLNQHGDTLQCREITAVEKMNNFMCSCEVAPEPSISFSFKIEFSGIKLAPSPQPPSIGTVLLKGINRSHVSEAGIYFELNYDFAMMLSPTLQPSGDLAKTASITFDSALTNTALQFLSGVPLNDFAMPQIVDLLVFLRTYNIIKVLSYLEAWVIENVDADDYECCLEYVKTCDNTALVSIVESFAPPTQKEVEEPIDEECFVDDDDLIIVTQSCN